MKRNAFLKKLDETSSWDFIIIGGGASGLGIALDAAARGYSVLLLERSDFAKGTSSRSTKLIHGGVRYQAQGNVGLVYEALHERGILLKNAPHLVKKQSFIIPCYSRLQKLKFWIGLKIYDWMSGKLNLGKSAPLSRQQVMEHLPNVVNNHLIGGIQYFDAQFDDARLAVNLAQTASEYGAVVLNYCEVIELKKREEKVAGVTAVDIINNKTYLLNGKVIVNATGVFVDEVLKLDGYLRNSLIRPSQGIHLVLDASFLQTGDAVLIPKTPDKRVLFVIPWHQHVLLGTTDTPIEQTLEEPTALEEEIDFILDTAKHYLSKAPRRQDVLSLFAGLRPLVASANKKSTKELSRNHQILTSPSGLITVVGGKWTTYRKMAEDVVNKAIASSQFEKRKCKTKDIKIHGYQESSRSFTGVYGSDEEGIDQLILQNPLLGRWLSDLFPYRDAHVIWAVREEMAMTVEDVLARRLRLLFLNAKEAMAVAPHVATLMAEELNRDERWIKSQEKAFHQLANLYLLNSGDVVSYGSE